MDSVNIGLPATAGLTDTIIQITISNHIPAIREIAQKGRSFRRVLPPALKVQRPVVAGILLHRFHKIIQAMVMKAADIKIGVANITALRRRFFKPFLLQVI